MDQDQPKAGTVSPVTKIGLVVLAAVSVAYAIQGAYRAQMLKSMDSQTTRNEEVTSVRRSMQQGKKLAGGPDIYQPQGLPRLELNVDTNQKPKMSTEEAMKRMSESGELQEISRSQFDKLADEMFLLNGSENEGEYPTREELDEIRRKGFIIR